MVRALVVDDSRIMRTVIRGHLRECGVEDENIVEAGNGREALDRLQQEPVELVVSDVNMPIMDGEELITWLSEGGFFRQGHAVIVTSRYERMLFRRLLHGGASTIIRKPFSLDVFLRQMEPVLQEIRRRGLTGSTLSDAPISDAAPHTPAQAQPVLRPQAMPSRLDLQGAGAPDLQDLLVTGVERVLAAAGVTSSRVAVQPRDEDLIVAEVLAGTEPETHLLLMADRGACDRVGESLVHVPPSDDDLRADALGELANVVAGAWCAELGLSAAFSVPNTTRASGSELVWQGLAGIELAGGERIYASVLR